MSATTNHLLMRTATAVMLTAQALVLRPGADERDAGLLQRGSEMRRGSDLRHRNTPACDVGPAHASTAAVYNLDHEADDFGVFCEGAPAWSKQNVPTPSLDGESLQLSIIGGDHGNVDFYRILDSEPSSNVFTLSLDFWFTPTTFNNEGSPSVIQALEFAGNKYDQGTRYEWALQLRFVGPGVVPGWRYWDPHASGDQWVDLAIGDRLAPEQFHHLRLAGRIIEGQVYYTGFSIDGRWHFLDKTVAPAPGDGPDRLAAAVQLDGNATESPYSVFIDRLTFERSAMAMTDVARVSDFDGDGNADPAIDRPSTGLWAALKSSTNFASAIYASWGLSTDVPVADDYDGDGKTDPAVFRPSTGTWHILESHTNYATSVSVPWGLGTDVPVPGDYDGDGKTDPAVFRPSTGGWHILKSSTNYTTSTSVSWGLTTDLPVPGDYDGDGKKDPAVFRAATGGWHILLSSSNYTSSINVFWGLSSDTPVPSDYDGDGKTDPAIYRASTGLWAILKSSTNYESANYLSWGLGTDTPVPGDFDGDGKADPAIYRPSTGLWAILKSSMDYTSAIYVHWGVSTDIPILRRP